MGMGARVNEQEFKNCAPELGDYCQTCGTKLVMEAARGYCKETGKQNGVPWCPHDKCHTRHDWEYVPSDGRDFDTYQTRYKCNRCGLKSIGTQWGFMPFDWSDDPPPKPPKFRIGADDSPKKVSWWRAWQ